MLIGLIEIKDIKTRFAIKIADILARISIYIQLSIKNLIVTVLDSSGAVCFLML